MGKDLDYKNLEAAWQRYTLDVLRIEERVTKLSLKKTEKIRLLRSILGICTEANKLLEQLSDNVFFSNPLDKQKLSGDLGCVLQHVAILANTLELPLNELLQKNKKTLLGKYPHKANQLDTHVESDYETEDWLEN